MSGTAAPVSRPDRVPEEPHDRTIDLALIAGLAPGDRIRIHGMTNRTLDLFERTVDLLKEGEFKTASADLASVEVRFIPHHADLRARFKFAEVLGSYSTLNSLLDRYAPVFELSQTVARTTRVAELSSTEVAMLEDYRNQVQLALEHANSHLALSSVADFTSEELHELNDILSEARQRFHELETVLGMRLIHDVEQAVRRLCELRAKISGVQRSISGIFLIESEILFVPSAEIVRIVDDIFKAIGNPFVIEHIDGTLLLAARNLLIQVVSFYAYYGREQIYQLYGANRGRSGRVKIAGYIRNEIKILFSACKANNKLVLTRVMDNTEREFEISIEAIQSEATRQAITEVANLVPIKIQVPKVPTRGLVARISNWLFRAPE